MEPYESFSDTWHRREVKRDSKSTIRCLTTTAPPPMKTDDIVHRYCHHPKPMPKKHGLKGVAYLCKAKWRTICFNTNFGPFDKIHYLNWYRLIIGKVLKRTFHNNDIFWIVTGLYFVLLTQCWVNNARMLYSIQREACLNHRSYFGLTKDIPYFVLMGELRGVSSK